ncbi:MAG: lamin tail domain-containing protein [bacterium]|nr:lamin tail domain-containing protein [bacterium]
MKPTILSLTLFLFGITVHPALSQIVLSEVMFNAPESEAYEEFLELYNSSSTNWINLNGFQIGDQDEQDSLVQHNGMGFILPAGGYALILDPQYWNNSTIYDDLIPIEALVLTINDNAFGANGFRNNPPDTVILKNPLGEIVASYTYHAGNTNGISDEKIRLTSPDQSWNWSNSRNYLGTPGFVNDVQPPQFDLSVAAFEADPSPLPYGSPLMLKVTIQNLGLTINSSGQVIFALIQGDSIPVDSLLGQVDIPITQPADSSVISLNLPSLPAGPQILKVWHTLADSNRANDTASVLLFGGYPEAVIIVNEIYPSPASGKCEWIEIYNSSGSVVDLAGFSISDMDTTHHHVISDSSRKLPPSAFAVIAADSTILSFPIPPGTIIQIPASGWPSLNDTGDQVHLYDAAAIEQDAVAYAGAAVSNGISIERVRYNVPSNDPANWADCTDPSGSTPGQVNSVTPLAFDLALSELSADPSPLPFGLALTVVVVLRNLGSEVIAGGEVFFELQQPSSPAVDSIIATIEFGFLAAGDSSQVQAIINGLPPGPQLIMARHDLTDENPVNDSDNLMISVGYPTRACVINEMMIHPLDERCEWVELFNPNTYAVNLYGFSFSDADTSQRTYLPVSAGIIVPAGYALLAKDSSIFMYNPPSGIPITIIGSSWPVLNDDGDTPTLFDAAGQMQDAVQYTGWSIPAGLSLERLSPAGLSSDETNWSRSLDPGGSTAGLPNSVQSSPSSEGRRADLTFTPDPYDPDRHGELEIDLSSPGGASSASIIVFDLRGRKLKTIFDGPVPSGQVTIGWDGKDASDRRLSPGLYVLYAEFRDSGGKRQDAIKKPLVIAGRL